MDLHRTVTEINGDFGRKLNIPPTPVYLTPLKFCEAGSAEKRGHSLP